MIGAHGEVQVLDWGLAVELTFRADGYGSADLMESKACAGTPSYISPEAATGNGKEIGAPIDVYGCGALLYRLLTVLLLHIVVRVYAICYCNRREAVGHLW